MKKLFFLLLIGCCIYSFAFAQTSDDGDYVEEDSASVESYDTAVAEIADPFIRPIKRTLSKDTLTALENDKAFVYMQYIDSVLRNKKIVEPPPQAIQKESPGLLDNQGLRTLYWLLAMAAVAFIAFRMFAGSSSLFQFNKRISVIKKHNETEDKITQNPDDLLVKAIIAKNYRLATRYLYLQTLTLLGERNALLIAPQKTNYQYVNEIKDKTLQQQFAVLTLHYEYAWFGNFNLNEMQFNSIEQQFRSFKNVIG